MRLMQNQHKRSQHATATSRQSVIYRVRVGVRERSISNLFSVFAGGICARNESTRSPKFAVPVGF